MIFHKISFQFSTFTHVCSGLYFLLWAVVRNLWQLFSTATVSAAGDFQLDSPGWWDSANRMAGIFWFHFPLKERTGFFRISRTFFSHWLRWKVPWQREQNLPLTCCHLWDCNGPDFALWGRQKAPQSLFCAKHFEGRLLLSSAFLLL